MALSQARQLLLGATLAGSVALPAQSVDSSAFERGHRSRDGGEPFPAAAFAAACKPWDDWDKPAPPFRIHGGTFHVGTCGISAVLVTSPAGHLLIDAGTEKSAGLVAANIEALGLSLRDVRFLTHTQEHHDHIGGIPELKERTGARLIAGPRAKPVFENGVLDRDDPQYESSEPNRRVAVDSTVAHGDSLVLGGKVLVAHFTPGHSPGAISWRWTECVGDDCRSLVFSDGLSPVAADGYRWTDHPEYLAAYRQSLTWIEAVEVDICLTAHPSQARLIERIEDSMLVDPSECRRMGQSIKARVESILAEERSASPVGGSPRRR